jgi:response regulator RpfG family c-di-GMP phosphodiesterase
VVENDALTAAQIQKYIEEMGYQWAGTADRAEVALPQIQQAEPDLVLMDIHLDGAMDGIELATRLQADSAVAVVYLTAYADDNTLARAKQTGPFGYLLKPFSRQDLKASIEMGLFKSAMERKQQRILDAVVHTIAELVRLHDPFLDGAQTRAAALAQAIARELQLPQQEVRAIHMAAMLSGLGLVGVPGDLLLRRSPPLPTHFDIAASAYVRKQPEIGYGLLKDIEFELPVAEMVYQHMERLDGSGFPRALAGEAILPGARVVAVACKAAKLLTPFGADAPLSVDATLAQLQAGSGTLYDAQVVAACVRLFREKGFAFVG